MCSNPTKENLLIDLVRKKTSLIVINRMTTWPVMSLRPNEALNLYLSDTCIWNWKSKKTVFVPKDSSSEIYVHSVTYFRENSLAHCITGHPCGLCWVRVSLLKPLLCHFLPFSFRFIVILIGLAFCYHSFLDKAWKVEN